MPGLAVNVVVIHQGQVLLTLRDDLEVWCLPSGGVEVGESLAQAAVRETLEETGLEVKLTRLVGVFSRHGAFRRDLHIALFAARPVGGALRTQPGETTALRCFAPDKLPADLAVGHRRRIEEALHGVTGVAWQQRLEPPMEDLPRQELYARRDRSGLARVEFYRQCMAGRELVETLEVGGETPQPRRSPLPLTYGEGGTPHPALYTNVAIVQEGRILLLQREDYETWSIPGGQVEAGESLAQAAAREAHEETGLEVRLTGLVGLYSLLGLSGGGHSVTFAGEVIGGTLQPQAGEAIDVRFFASDELPADLFVAQRQRIDDALNQTRAVAWRQEFVPRLFQGVGGRQELYALRDRSGLPRAEFPRQALQGSRLEEAREV